MLPISRLTIISLYLSAAFTIALSLFVLPIEPVNSQDTPRTPIPTQKQPLRLQATSEKTLNFEDIYQIKLNLEIPGDIEIVAAEDDIITVKLEKQTQATNTERDTLTRAYLDNISITETRNDGTLQLDVQLPTDDITVVKPNPPTHLPDPQAIPNDQLRLKWTINTPADVALNIQNKTGNVRLKRIRGKIEVTTDTGSVQLHETLGNYNISVKDGNIGGKILLTHGQNKILTQNGSIGLIILDTVAAPMDVTAQGGGIRLELPENYAVDAELESEKQQIVVNLPAQIDNATSLTLINDGGPLFRLKATDAISVLQSSSEAENGPSDSTSDSFADFSQTVLETAQPPVIDGNLSEIAWQRARTFSPFQNADGTEEPQNPTQTALLWDAEHLYIGVKAYIPETQIPHISQTQHDSPIWEDECIEILMDPNLKTDTYYHFVINPIGALFDQQVNLPGSPYFRFAPQDVQLTISQDTMKTDFDADSDWNSNAKVATEINTAFWSVEIAIPREMLEKPANLESRDGPANENRWLFNIHRKAYTDTRSAVNPVRWLFNIHRKAYTDTRSAADPVLTTQREYSYWQPTYDTEHPWWLHAPQQYVGALSERSAPAMGLLNFVTLQSESAETFTAEEQFLVSAIQIEGNTKIPTEAILPNIPIQSGSITTGSQLAWLIAELRNHDWFQDVRLETRPEQLPQEQLPVENQNLGTFPTFSVHIRVTEAPVISAQLIKIDGNRSFPTYLIKEWFQLNPGYIAVTAVTLKAQLIANFYSNRGYEFATVNPQSINDTLEFHINEGSLDEIRFTGNSRISRPELLSALDLRTEVDDGEHGSETPDIYHRTLGGSKVNRMRRELRENNEHFKAIRGWRVQREGGKNVMIVEIEEQPIAKPGAFPIIQFNRVHGLMLGAGGTLTTQFTGSEQVFGSISRGFSSKIWNYHAGIEKGVFKQQPLKLGASFYKLTDVSSNNYLHHGNPTLSASYYGSALQDYYERSGAQGWITYAPSEWSFLRLEITDENHDNLSKSTDWSYLNRYLRKRGNARIERGQLRNLALVFAFDTRDHRSISTRYFHTLFSANERTRRGWRGQLAVETTGQYLGGDYDFNFYRFEIARYTPLSGPHQLNVRVAGDFSDAPLPRQRLLHLGGGNTLRGYDFNRFAGDNRLLLNLEYRLINETINTNAGDVFGWILTCFLDTGSIWWHGEAPFANFQTFTEQIKASVGVGGSVFIDPFGNMKPWSLALEVSEALDSSFSLRNPIIVLRFDRIF